MIRASQSSIRQPSLGPSSGAESTAYGRPFWLAYVANLLIMVAISLLFRYADFVVLLGGTELQLGWIVGVGMVGSLAVRLALGTGIDHYGPGAVWLASAGLFAISCFAHLAITICHGPAVYLVRMAWCCSIAGIFGAAITFVSSRASASRMAEMIGMLGTSGFLGMVLGTQLGDLLLSGRTIGREQVDRMFLAAGLLGIGSGVFAWLATRGQRRPVPTQRPPLWQVLRSHFPVAVIVMGTAMGIGLSLPGTFLRPYAAELGISRIGAFFGVYAPTALVARVLTRRLPERLGTTPMILAGIAALAGSQLLFLLVDTQWKLIVPGIGYGVAHAILFPSVVAAGSSRFPPQHRGLATTLLLGTWDAGQLVGAPAVGAILHCSGWIGLPSYPTMFTSMACLLAAVGVFYTLIVRRTPPRSAAGSTRDDGTTAPIEHTTPTV